jgi:hypothetical protein
VGTVVKLVQAIFETASVPIAFVMPPGTIPKAQKASTGVALLEAAQNLY